MPIAADHMALSSRITFAPGNKKVKCKTTNVYIRPLIMAHHVTSWNLLCQDFAAGYDIESIEINALQSYSLRYIGDKNLGWVGITERGIADDIWYNISS